jgi:ribonuclease HI
MKSIEIYTDGGSLGNPGPGGYGAVLLYGDNRKELSGGYRYTTNNRMEIMAVIKALEAIKSKGNAEINIYTDSRLVYDAFEKKWIYGWEKKNWLKSDKKPVLNDDLWKTLLSLVRKYKVKFYWVKAHSGIEENEICDALVKDSAMNEPSEPDTNYEIVSGYSPEDNIRKTKEFIINQKKDFFIINDKYGNKIKIDNHEINDFLLQINLLVE